jgi:hypothetical protein
MTRLDELQSRFMNYLLQADKQIVTDISTADGEGPERRLSIYYNAYRMRLFGSIEIDHPVLGLYLGDQGFEKMAQAYIASHPSNQTSLRHFCDQLPEFLGASTPFREIGILKPLAKFERLLMEVFDAADAQVETLEKLTSMPADHWPVLTLQFHPAVRLLVTQWNEVEIWRAIKAQQAPPDAIQGDKRAWLLWRNQKRLTEFRSLPMDEYTMLSKALDGESFAALCETLLEWHSDSSVAERAWFLLRNWIEAGLIISNDRP